MQRSADQHQNRSILSEGLRAITRFVSDQPRLTLWLVGISALLSIVLTITNLKFKPDRSDLIDPEAAFHQRWLNYTESFGDAADAVATVEADSPEAIKGILDELGEQLDKEPVFFKDVLYKVEPGKLRQKGLQYLTPNQLNVGLKRVAAYRPVLHGEWERVRLDALVNQLRYQIDVYDQLPEKNPQQIHALLQHAEMLSDSLIRGLRDQDDFRSPWPEVVPVDPGMKLQGQQVSYFLNSAGTMGLLRVKVLEEEAGSMQGPAKALNRLREILVELQKKHTEAKLGLTGIPVLEYDEMQKAQSDMLMASLLSVGGVSLVLFFGFRGLRHPALAFLMLSVGMAWAFGYTTLVVGHLNILSMSFAAILIGLGIDFGIHYLAKYLERRHAGDDLQEALVNSSGSVGVGIVAAAITTSMAFLCATFTQFLGVAELGIIAGGGILLCALATFLVLPALITISDEDTELKTLPSPFQGNALRSMVTRFPGTVLFCSLVLISGVGAMMVQKTDDGFQSRIRYDYNLLNLQADGLDSVEVQKRIFSQHNDSLLYAVSLASSPEEARLMKQKFEALPTVQRVEELASHLPAAPSEKTSLFVQALRAELARLPRQPEQVVIRNPAPVGYAVERLYNTLRRHSESIAAEAAQNLDRFLDEFASLHMQKQLQYLNTYQGKMNYALLRQFQGLAAASDTTPVTMEDLPPELTTRYKSSDGKWLLQVFPKEQIWDIDPLTAFVKDVRTVDENATGTPLQNYEASQQIMKSYEQAALLALIAVLLVLLIDFLSREQKYLILLPPLALVVFTGVALQIRKVPIDPLYYVAAYALLVCLIAFTLDFQNLRDAWLAMLPPIAGGILMMGILAILNIPLNPANLIVLPLVLGIGVDDGVHVVHDFRSQLGNYKPSSSTVNGIVLTSLTSMIGFGSMMLASHRGLYSVGMVLVVGVGSCLFVSLVTLPAMLALFSDNDDDESEAKYEETEAPQQRRSSKKRRTQVDAA